MGLDVYIDKCRKPKIIDNKRSYEEREEVCYWRKFWGLLDIMQYGNSEYGQDIRLTKDDVEKILNYATHNRDYFDGFESVPQICELLDKWDELQDEGWVFCFNANW